MIIPNSPGGGYDQTGRAAVRVSEDDNLTGRFEVTNVIGAGGTVAMQRVLNERGSKDLLMTMGLGVVGSTFTNKSSAKASRMTPIARLIDDQEGVLVPGDSPYKTMDDVARAWKADPRSVVVGGGSSPGGPDYLFPMLLAKKIGIDPKKVNYIVYDGGGPLTTALLGSKIKVGFSGVGEFESQIKSGALRLLAVSGEQKLRGYDAPTLRQTGIDLTFANWRGVLAPPGIDKATRDKHIALLRKMHDSAEWRKQLRVNGWTDSFITGDRFGAFLRQQDALVASTLKELGLK